MRICNESIKYLLFFRRGDYNGESVMKTIYSYSPSSEMTTSEGVQ